MTGILDYDETRTKYISTRFGGRLDHLYVDYTGVLVKKGEHLVDIYSPELNTAQEELIQSLKIKNEFKNKGSDILVDTAEKTLESSKEKLRLWGLTELQIEDLEKNGNVADRITIYSPISGIVIEKNAFEGLYVETGTKIYTIADISGLWLKIDAYESDLSSLHYGQKVEFEVESYPGELFTGRISFIDPTIDRTTRTIKLRVNVDNTRNKLKPGMFVRASVSTKLDSKSNIIDSEVAGKWLCSMHPEIIKMDPDHATSVVCPLSLQKSTAQKYPVLRILLPLS
jgi:membrane fusion protein, copper/silver efflux system